MAKRKKKKNKSKQKLCEHCKQIGNNYTDEISRIELELRTLINLMSAVVDTEPLDSRTITDLAVVLRNFLDKMRVARSFYLGGLLDSVSMSKAEIKGELLKLRYSTS